MNTDTRVDDCIAGLPEWQRDICREVCRLGAKDHVNVMLYDKAVVPDPENIVTSGHGNRTARMISVYRDQPLNAPALVEMFRHIIANNRRRRSVGPRR